jgi:hypothetical protein
MEPLNMAPAGSQSEPQPEPADEPEEEATAPAVPVIIESPVEPQRPPIDIAPLVADVAARIVGREIVGLNARIAHAANDPAAYFAWAVTWFEGHRDYAVKAVAPLVAASASPLDTSAWAAEYCSATVQEFASREPASVLKDWESTKAGKLAATIGEALCTTAS